jgi:heme exporter protein C
MIWDRRAASCAELGVLFCSLVLITGPLWARPVWGVWWTWDIRLSTTLVLWLMYAAYLILRSVVVDPQRRAAVAAVVAVIGFVNVPLSYLSIRWWRTQHPSPVLAGGCGSGLDPAMRVAFFISLAAFTALFLYLLKRRVQLAAAEGKIEDLYRRLDHLKVQGARRS